LCVDCHSPRNEKAGFIESQHLSGAPITESEVAHFLVTGERPHGRPPALPPMPPYRFNHEDAAAIAAYLYSLPANPSQ
jgi:mono/diheme cytochrome c family protein